MSYALLEKEMESLDEAQRDAVVMFARFLVSQKSNFAPVAVQKFETHGGDQSWEAFERIRAKAAIDHKDHEWTMDEIDAEIAASRRERRERQLAGRDDDTRLVTGNLRHYPISPIVVTPAQMVAIIEERFATTP